MSLLVSLVWIVIGLLSLLRQSTTAELAFVVLAMVIAGMNLTVAVICIRAARPGKN